MIPDNPAAQGFWIRLRLRSRLGKSKRNQWFDDFQEFLGARNLVSQGGALLPWDWQSFVTPLEDWATAGEADRMAIVTYLKNSSLVENYEVGELVDREPNEIAAFEVLKEAMIQAVTLDPDRP